MKVLGIDPGLGRVGWGLLEKVDGNDQPKFLKYGLVETKSNQSEAKRLQTIYRQVCGIIEEANPEIVAVEQLYFFSNQKTAFSVSQARGVIILAIADNQKKIVDVTPLQVKQAVTGYGRASKEQVQEMVKVILGLKERPQPDDIADGLAIAICATSLTDFERKIKRRD
jgi:crossover junction endodeoxyribonuclease RuvC